MRVWMNLLISPRSTCKVWNLGRDQNLIIILIIKRKELWEQIILCNLSKDIWKRVPSGRRSSSNLLTIEELLTFIRKSNTWMILKIKSAKQSTTKMVYKNKQLAECIREATISICISRSHKKFRYRGIFSANKTSATGIWVGIMKYNKWLKICC